MNRKITFILVCLVIMLLNLHSVKSSWWDNSYPYRYKIVANTTSGNLEYPFAINDTFGIGNHVIWGNINGSNINYVYCKIAGCKTDLIAIANDTAQKCWENEKDGSGNCINQIYSPTAVAIYHFGQQGKVIDSINSLNNNSVTYNTYAKSPFNNSMVFDGTTSSEVIIPDNNLLDLAGSYTITLWINITTAGTYRALAKVDGVKYNFDIAPRIDRTIQIQMGDDLVGNPYCTGATALTLNTWYHIAVVYTKGSTLKLYVNGTEDCSAVDTIAGTVTGITPMEIGGLTGTNIVQGSIDEIRIYNSTKTQLELQQEYYNGINNMTRTSGEEAGTDTTKPYFTIGGTNATGKIKKGDIIKVFIQGIDETQLSNMWVSTNETGIWRNYTNYDFYKYGNDTGSPIRGVGYNGTHVWFSHNSYIDIYDKNLNGVVNSYSISTQSIWGLYWNGTYMISTNTSSQDANHPAWINVLDAGANIIETINLTDKVTQVIGADRVEASNYPCNHPTDGNVHLYELTWNGSAYWINCIYSYPSNWVLMFDKSWNYIGNLSYAVDVGGGFVGQAGITFDSTNIITTDYYGNTYRLNQTWWLNNGTCYNNICDGIGSGKCVLQKYDEDVDYSGNSRGIEYANDTEKIYIGYGFPVDNWERVGMYENTKYRYYNTNTFNWFNFTWMNETINSGIIGIKFYANDSSGNENVSDIISFDYGNIPSISQYTPALASGVTYAPNKNYGFQATITDITDMDYIIMPVKFETDCLTGAFANYTNTTTPAWTNTTGIYTINFTGFPVRNCQYAWYANNSLNNKNTTGRIAYTITQNSSLFYSWILTSPITYNTLSDFQMSETVIGDDDCTYTLLRNGTSLGTGSTVTDTTILSAGIWNYSYSRASCTNYSFNAVEKDLTISKGTPTITLLLNSSSANAVYNNESYANFTTRISVSDSRSKTINLISNQTGFLLASGTNSIINYTYLTYVNKWFNLTGYFDGDTNYSAVSQTYYYDVKDMIIPVLQSSEFNDTYININQTAKLIANITDNLGVSTVLATIVTPNATTFNVTMQKEANGNYTYNISKGDLRDTQTNIGTIQITKIYANDTYNNWNVSTVSLSFIYATAQLSALDAVPNPTYASPVYFYANYTTIENEIIYSQCNVTSFSNTTIMYWNPSAHELLAIIDPFVLGMADGIYPITFLCFNSSYQTKTDTGRTVRVGTGTSGIGTGSSGSPSTVATTISATTTISQGTQGTSVIDTRILLFGIISVVFVIVYQEDKKKKKKKGSLTDVI